MVYPTMESGWHELVQVMMHDQLRWSCTLQPSDYS